MLGAAGASATWPVRFARASRGERVRRARGPVRGSGAGRAPLAPAHGGPGAADAGRDALGRRAAPAAQRPSAAPRGASGRSRLQLVGAPAVKRRAETSARPAHEGAKGLTDGCDCASHRAPSTPPSSRPRARATTPTAGRPAGVDGRSGAGQGRRAPLEFIPSEIAPNLPQKAGDSSTAPPRRARSATPRRLTADEYRRQTAEALDRMGAPHLGAALRRCGREVRAYACDACGDPWGYVERPLSCGLRCCPDCARALAADRVRSLARAVDGVASTVAARAVVAQLAEARRENEALDRAAYWSARTGPRAAELARAAERDAADARWRAGRVREALRGAWSWKLVTVSPQWRPEDPAETTAGGLRARTVALLDALRAVLARRYDVGGLASWSVSAEVSAGGHVHCHALAFGPWIHTEAFARAVSAELGRTCFVDARQARVKGGVVDARSAAREALKYALKGPSPRRAAWVLGESRAEVPAPELAAAMTLGLRRLQTTRHRGTIRAAFRAAAARERRREASPALCASCGHVLDLTGGRVESWRACVAELRRRAEWATAERPRAPGPADRARWTGDLLPEMMPVRVRVYRGRARPLDF